jgi:hypothetical protein
VLDAELGDLRAGVTTRTSSVMHDNAGDLHKDLGRADRPVLIEVGACVPVAVIRLTRSRIAAGEIVVRLGVPLLDEYLEFLAGRCRPNTVLAVAYDLKVFFTVVKKTPRRVRAADVLAFKIAQLTGRKRLTHAPVPARTTADQLGHIDG